VAVNKNFAIKNGLEVNTDLILANADTNKVGIGTSIPYYTLHVFGGIGATDVQVTGVATVNLGIITTLQGTNLNYSGVSTITSLRGTTAEYDTFYGDVGIITSFNTTGIGTIETKLNVGAGGTVLTAFVNSGVGSVGIGTSLPAYTLDIRGPVSTGVTALYVQGDVRVTGDLSLDDVSLDQANIGFLNVTGFATASNIFIAGIGSITSQVGLITNITGTNLNYSGIGTVVNLRGTNLNYTGVGTIGTLYGTSVEFDNLYADVGIVTTLRGTNLNYTGVGTIGTLYGTNIEFDNLYADVGIVTNVRGTNLNYTGVGTIARLVGTSAEFDNLYADVGIVTNITATNLNVIGIASIGTVNIAGAALTSLTVSQSSNLGGIATINAARINAGIVTSFNVTGVATIPTLYGTSAEFDNLYADVGIVTTLRGTNLSYSGVSTISTLYGTNIEFDNLYADVGIVTTLRGTNLNYTGVGTIGTLYGTNIEFDNLYADVGIVTTLRGTNLTYSGIASITNAIITGVAATSLNVSGVGTINAARINAGIITSLNVTGVTTLGTIRVSSGIVTASSGVVTYYGDGQYLTGVTRGVGIASTNPSTGLASVVGFGATIITFKGPGISTTSPIEVSAGIATITFEGGGGSGGYQTTIFKESYTVTSASQSVFNLVNAYTSGYIDVYLNGVKLNSGDFTETDADTITLSTAALNGDIVEFVNYKVVAITGDFETRIVKEEFTVTAATQSVFSLSNAYTAGYIDVYLNGSKLTSSDYSETTSSSITLTSAAVTGDVVEVINYEKRSISEVDFPWINILSGATKTGIYTSGVNVGVGTTIPTSLLHVNGNVLINGIGTVTSSFNVGTALTAASIVVGSATTINSTGLNAIGVVTATTFKVGAGQTINSTGINVTGVVTATSGSFSGNVSVGGVLTFEDVTNVDSIGVITARNGVQITGGGGLNITGGAGIITATSAIVGSAVTINNTGINVTGIVTASSDIKIGTNSVATNGKAIAMAMVFGG
jgi:hypothetical protein